MHFIIPDNFHGKLQILLLEFEYVVNCRNYCVIKKKYIINITGCVFD